MLFKLLRHSTLLHVFIQAFCSRLTMNFLFVRCVVDSYTTILSQGTHETRFVFNAFEFPQSHGSVYVYCNTTFCDTMDANQRCSQTCNQGPAIVGRSIDSDYDSLTRELSYYNFYMYLD